MSEQGVQLTTNSNGFCLKLERKMMKICNKRNIRVGSSSALCWAYLGGHRKEFNLRIAESFRHNRLHFNVTRDVLFQEKLDPKVRGIL